MTNKRRTIDLDANYGYDYDDDTLTTQISHDHERTYRLNHYLEEVLSEGGEQDYDDLITALDNLINRYQNIMGTIKSAYKLNQARSI